MPIIESSADGAVLSSAQTGNGDSTNIVARSMVQVGQVGGLVLTTTVGSTPTVTINIQGSMDGVNWANAPYTAENTLTQTYVITALTITTAKTGFYTLQPNIGWRFLKLVYSANTNVTITATAYLE